MCEICSKRFTANNDLKKHLRIHSDGKPFICGACSKKFCTYSNLENHIRTHRKSFICEICSKAFFYKKYGLVRHFDSRTNEKTLLCNVCSKIFSRENSLKSHFDIYAKKRSSV